MNTNNDKRTVSVIGVGLPRTGTLSLKHALEKLLPGKCYHMVEAFNHAKEWRKLCDGQMSDEEFKNLFVSNGYVATVDAPVCLEYKRAMRVFPDAKFLLTIREPQSWVDSMLKTVVMVDTSFKSFPLVLFRWFIDMMKHLPQNSLVLWDNDKLDNYREMIDSCKEGRGKEFFNKWTDELKNTIPNDKLLIYNVRDGWEPLCAFLDVQVPEEKFPNVNSTTEFLQHFEEKRKEGSKFVIQVVVAVLLLVIATFWMTS